ncbi:TBC1 domain family member 8 [Sesamum angolense]|uniref:TBC1 domain family member 8 n=1 Tax=Sesamum angolense TaxID=2727404 RepID=A0AAE2BNQ0_9LAMI|nr:TBC1 domain family member 8 [Sesamum angolense]
MLLSLLSKRSLYDESRDTYGFTVRPQHIHRYREYAHIYKEEEEERLQKWKSFLEQQADPTSEDIIKPVVSEDTKQPSDPAQTVSGECDDSTEPNPSGSEVTEKKTELAEEVSEEADDSSERKTEPVEKVSEEADDSSEKRPVSDTGEESVPSKETPATQHARPRVVQKWAEIRPSLNYIDHMMSVRVKKRKNMTDEKIIHMHNDLPSIDEARPSGEESDNEDKDVFCDKEIIDDSANASAVESSASDKMSRQPFFPWKQELEFLVQGGVPKDLRGEVWQAFVGARTRRVERYYQDLLGTESDASDGKEHDKLLSGDNKMQHEGTGYDLPEKLKKQIEKDLPRTFPGHPALNENGRNSLRRVLWAYARHNPSVGYCQAMNFFAGLLLLMMPEENAFWTLVGIIDDYFEGYFSQEMIESQVDQLVFEDLMRERFPKLVNHLDYLGVEVAWISGPWFLSIFVNMLPWESVLRVWDVLLFEGNRVMLFRTALALMDLYGPAIVTTKDAGDAITLLQTLTGSTFDSSQLVLTACMGFLTITEDRLQELREQHRPAIVATVEERAKGGRVFKDPKGLATKLYSFKHNPESIVKENKNEAVPGDKVDAVEISDLDSEGANLDEFLKGITIDSEVDSLPDLQEQVVWLKVELCRLLAEKRSAVLRVEGECLGVKLVNSIIIWSTGQCMLNTVDMPNRELVAVPKCSFLFCRAEELEAALMEMVTEDNRRELSARVEQLEQEVAELRQALADKKDGENAMLQVLIKVEQEQRETEDARLFAEQDAAAQRQAVQVLQEKYNKAMSSLAEMEKRAVMAESMLEATLNYESGQNKASSSPRFGRVESPRDASTKKTGILPFGLSWRDRKASFFYSNTCFVLSILTTTL